MRNKLLFILALPLIFAACKKSDECFYTTTDDVAATAEIASLKAWLDASSLTYTQHPSGIFYKVINPGTGATPGICSDVTVKYIGRLTTGYAFDSSYKRDPDGTTFTLGELIPAWQLGIPLIQKGGSIILYVPPSMGYGSAANGPIPANSNLIFNIELINVK